MTTKKVTITWVRGASVNDAPNTSANFVRPMAVDDVVYTDADVVSDSKDPTNPNKRWIDIGDGFVAVDYPNSAGEPKQRATVEVIGDTPQPAERSLMVDVRLDDEGIVYEATNVQLVKKQ